MTGKYRYKVTDLTRQSCIVPTASKFSLIYQKNTIVKAPSGTIGIMVFKSQYYASNFAVRCLGPEIKYRCKILKVRPIGRQKKMPQIISDVTYSAYDTTRLIINFNKFLLEIKNYSKQRKEMAFHRYNYQASIPDGTQCYGAVEVLE